MEGDLLTQLGVGGVFVLLVLREIFGFIRPILEKRAARKADGEATPPPAGAPDLNGSTKKIAAQMTDIHRILNRTDVDGTPLVYIPRSLGEAVHELAHATAEQTKMLERLDSNMTEARREIRAVAQEKK